MISMYDMLLFFSPLSSVLGHLGHMLYVHFFFLLQACFSCTVYVCPHMLLNLCWEKGGTVVSTGDSQSEASEAFHEFLSPGCAPPHPAFALCGLGLAPALLQISRVDNGQTRSMSHNTVDYTCTHCFPTVSASLKNLTHGSFALIWSRCESW